MNVCVCKYVCRHIGMRLFVHRCIINLFFCCCLAFRLYEYVYTDESSAPSSVFKLFPRSS